MTESANHHQQQLHQTQTSPVDSSLAQRLSDIYMKNIQSQQQAQEQQHQLQMSPTSSLLSQIRAAHQQQQQQHQQNGHIELSSLNGADSSSIPIIKSEYSSLS